MRIIGGQARGQRLDVPRGRSTRPTSDRVRESIFSILQSALGGFDGLSALDLYAGSGALGLEALSRGAARAIFVDSDPACKQVIKRNLARLGFDSRCQVLRMRVRPALDLLDQRGEIFELVFADPPYAVDPTPTLQHLGQSGRLAPGGLLVLEHGRHGGWERSGPLPEGGLTLKSERRYGDTLVSIFANTGAGAGQLT